jgi:hypothetical protein
MATVKEKEDVRVGQEAINLGDALDVGGGVMVEDWLKPPFPRCICSALDALHEEAPARAL